MQRKAAIGGMEYLILSSTQHEAEAHEAHWIARSSCR